jgi:hypothetical protein
MTEDFGNIDQLINDHTNRQLSTVDWEQLNAHIQTKLDAAQKHTLAVSIKSRRLRWAVGMSSAAAILLIVFMLTNNKKQPLSLPPGQQAAVTLSKQSGVAKTEIEKPVASVSINLPAECDVTIMDQNGHPENEDTPRPSWIIMTASKPASSPDRMEKDQLDIACML